MTANGPAAVSGTAAEWRAEDERAAGMAATDERVLDMASTTDADGFMRRHEDELLSFFQARAPQPADADDLVQESVIRLLRYRRAMPESSLKLLMFRIARNLLNDFWRWNRRHRIEEPTDPSDLAVESAAPSQERMAELGQEMRRLERFLLSLPAKCRAVFVLSRVRGMSNQEVARHLGISEKMVEKHIARALAACRERLGAPAPREGGRVDRTLGR